MFEAKEKHFFSFVSQDSIWASKEIKHGHFLAIRTCHLQLNTICNLKKNLTYLMIFKITPWSSDDEDSTILALTISQFSSVAQLCPTLCNPMNRSMPGLPVHHQLLEFTQTHVHQVGDAILPSHPLSYPSPPAPNPLQH